MIYAEIRATRMNGWRNMRLEVEERRINVFTKPGVDLSGPEPSRFSPLQFKQPEPDQSKYIPDQNLHSIGSCHTLIRVHTV